MLSYPINVVSVFYENISSSDAKEAWRYQSTGPSNMKGSKVSWQAYNYLIAGPDPISLYKNLFHHWKRQVLAPSLMHGGDTRIRPVEMLSDFIRKRGQGSLCCQLEYEYQVTKNRRTVSGLRLDTFNDRGHELFTAVPKTNHVSPLMLPGIHLAMRLRLHIRDFSYALVTNPKVLCRYVYTDAPMKMEIATGKAGKVLCVVYGIRNCPCTGFKAYCSL